MPLNNRETDKGSFTTLLKEKGIYDALRFINEKSSHRFTALYAFDGPVLHNICLVDKQDSSIRQMNSIDIAHSYCFYVRDSGQKFIVPDSLADERVAGHPKQATIQSYCGMPLMNSSHEMLGTLCHFDFIPLAYTDAEVRLLELVSPAIVGWLEDSQMQNRPRQSSNSRS